MTVTTEGGFPSFGITNAHQSALRSIERVVHDVVPLQDPIVAAAGISSLLTRGNVVVLTGAGVSTDSGIPDYRGPAGSLTKHRPMTYQEFKYDPAARQRYWARSYIGWQVMNIAVPNPAHTMLADLERGGVITGIITQNVDGLHSAAGSQNVVPIHGDLATVVCLDCGERIDRVEFSLAMQQANPDFADRVSITRDQVQPDGDVVLSPELISDFNQIPCRVCGSYILKPDVVYFGENVPPERKVAAAHMLDSSDGLLVVGSSLAVMSGYKFVLDAQKQGKTVGVINGGPTRADDHIPYRWRTQVIPALETLKNILL